AVLGPILLVLGPIISTLGTLASAFTFLLSPVGLVVAAIGAAIAIGVLLYKNWDEVVGFIKNLWSTFSDWFMGLWGQIGSWVLLATGPIGIAILIWKNFDDIVARLQGLWEGFKDRLLGIWESIKSGIRGAVNGIIEIINSMIRAINRIEIRLPKIPDWVPGIGGRGGGSISFPNIPTIPKLASGGIVTRPTLAMIGEAGPEAVIPLNRGAAAAGSGPITINNSGTGGVEDITERLVGEIRRRLALR